MNLTINYLFTHFALGYYFRVWLAFLNTVFMLSYMDHEDHDTKVMEEVVLYEVSTTKGYLSDCPSI